jgi:pimeloyl-ACP methyl ester carboxylesterase
MTLRNRAYGTTGPLVVVLHGGPGAPGYMAPVARGLADAFRVLEPFQRSSGGARLTVDRHVRDLDELIVPLGTGARPALVGSSWGAMLALAYAAAHPTAAGPLVLVGCGTFDKTARTRMQELLEERKDDPLRRRLRRLPEEIPDPDQRLAAAGRLIQPLYTYEGMPGDPGPEACDAAANLETWGDMLRLQAEGVYPAAFAAIKAPVLMLHGTFDPHPGPMIRAGLKPHLPQLEYRELERCGHFPWLERWAHEEFFAVLHGWLAAHLLGPVMPSPVTRPPTGSGPPVGSPPPPGC